MRPTAPLVASGVGVVALAATSVLVGAADVRLPELFSDREQLYLLAVSRVPRTLAVVLAGASMSLAGLIMQTVARNKFVEPATSGVMQSAGLGMLLTTMYAPGAPVAVKAVCASAAALAGSAVFLALLRRVRSGGAVVPLIGVTLGAIIGATAQFLALRHDLSQTLVSWESGSFAGAVLGRYELLWLVGPLTLIAYLMAGRFTIAGAGRETATGVGLDHRLVVEAGVLIVSAITGTVVAVVGYLPFLGLIVPNLVSLAVGDDVRRGVPLVCLFGAAVVLACDIVCRTVRAPFEIPAGTVLGVVGGSVFVTLLLRQARHA